MIDPDLKAYLDSMRQDLTDQIAGVSEHAERLNRETREHAERLNRETREHAERLNQEAREHAERLSQEAREHAERLNQETREHAEQLNQETRVLLEDVRHDVKGVADGVLLLNEKLALFQEATVREISNLDHRVMRIEARMGSDA